MNFAIKLPDDLVGWWWFDHESGDSPGLLIVEPGGKAVQFHTTKRRLRKGEVLRLWYTVSDSRTIRFRPKPTGDGWPRVVARTDNGLSIAAEDKVFPMWPVKSSELPEWLEEDYQAAVNLMRAQEEAELTPEKQGEQGSADNTLPRHESEIEP